MLVATPQHPARECKHEQHAEQGAEGEDHEGLDRIRAFGTNAEGLARNDNVRKETHEWNMTYCKKRTVPSAILVGRKPFRLQIDVAFCRAPAKNLRT